MVDPALWTDINTISRLPMKVSAKLIADGIIFNGPCVLQGFIIKTDGTNDLLAEFYDDNPGDWKGGLEIPGSNLSGGLMFPQNPIRIATHLRVDITGTVGTGWVTAYYNNYDPQG